MSNRRFRGTVECYDCHQQVENLKQHRKSCANRRPKGKGRGKGRGGPRGGPRQVECYTCGLMVESLKKHRSTCAGVRVALGNDPSAVAPDSPAEQATRKGRRRGKKGERGEEQKVSLDDFGDTKDVYFILDVSGSMSGSRLATAKSTAREIFAQMNENDRISIVTFDNKAFFKLKPRAVGQIRRQNEFEPILDKIFARGGTALYDAVYISIDQIRNKDRHTVMVVYTDGDDNCSTRSLQSILDLLVENRNVSLSLVHIQNSGVRSVSYETLCENRGEYVVTIDANVQEETLRVFKQYY